jgi:hypothetical protein
MATRPITRQFSLPEAPGEAHTRILTDFSRALGGRYRYGVTAQSERSITYTCRFRPVWAVVLGVLTFWTIIGLFFFAIKDTDTLVFDLKPQGDGTLVTLTGSGPPELDRLFDTAFPENQASHP